MRSSLLRKRPNGKANGTWSRAEAATSLLASGLGGLVHSLREKEVGREGQRFATDIEVPNGTDGVE